MSKIKINFKMPPESVAQKLYRRQQELRKKSGLPDPEEYKKRMQQYDKEPGMKKESVYVDEKPDTGGDSRNIKSVVSDVDPQKKKRMDDALATANKTAVAEAGPFSYGAKPPRRNSLADQIAKKRQELQRKQPATEPRDQMVGTAKVTKEDIEQVDELRTSTLLRYATKANKSLIGGDRNKEEKRIKGIQKANYKIQTRHRVKEDAEQIDEVGDTAKGQKLLMAVNKRAVSRLVSKRADTDPAYAKKAQQTHLAADSRLKEAWSMNGRNPQRGVKVGDKVRSYDFPGMHDDHYIEGHVVADNPHTYHIRVNKVVRSGKEIPVPAHMQHVEAPKGRGSFSNAYAVHKMMAKQQSVTAAPEPATGAQKTFGGMRNRLREAAGYWGQKSASDIEKIKKALEKERRQAANNPGALTKKKPPSRVKKDVQFYDYMAKTKT